MTYCSHLHEEEHNYRKLWNQENKFTFSPLPFLVPYTLMLAPVSWHIINEVIADSDNILLLWMFQPIENQCHQE